MYSDPMTRRDFVRNISLAPLVASSPLGATEHLLLAALGISDRKRMSCGQFLNLSIGIKDFASEYS